MEFLVELDVTVPRGAPEPQIEERERAEAATAAALAHDWHAVRRWKPPGEGKAIRIVRAAGETPRVDPLGALPRNDRMATVNPLEHNPNDPGQP